MTSANRLITLLTDFGLDDIYVGVMKGVIAQVNPSLTIVDLTHQIPPQNVLAAQFNLTNAYPYFPAGTVHIAVVDPGVGGERRAIAIELADGYLVGPDNGLFTSLLKRQPALRVVELSNRQYWRIPDPSHTFHGRDIFAAVGAHLANGISIPELGQLIDPNSLVQLPIPICEANDKGFSGSVQYIDRFGNVITNIPGDVVKGKNWSIVIGKNLIPGCRTYGDVPPNHPLALIGSHGWVEIAVSNGDARYQLRLHVGDRIQVVI